MLKEGTKAVAEPCFKVFNFEFKTINIIFVWYSYIDMSDKVIIENFISKLKTIAVKAREEKVSVQAIHARIKRGLYKTVDICGIIFIIVD